MRYLREKVEAAGGDWEVAELCNDALDNLSGQRVEAVSRAGRFERSKLAWKAEVLRQGLIYRLVDIGEGAIASWSADNWIVSLIACRSLVETVACLHGVESKVSAAIDGGDLRTIDGNLMSETFATKDPSQLFDNNYVATNILTRLKKIDRDVGGVEQYYARLSEHAHPNWAGHVGFYSDVDRGIEAAVFSRFSLSKEHIAKKVLAGTLSLAWAERLVEKMTGNVESLIAIQTR